MENKNTTLVPSINLEERAREIVKEMEMCRLVLVEYNSKLLNLVSEICKSEYVVYDYTVRVRSGESMALLEPNCAFLC